MAVNGKGSTPRPRQVGDSTWSDNWDRTFGKRDPREKSRRAWENWTDEDAKHELLPWDDEDQALAMASEPVLEPGHLYSDDALSVEHPTIE